MWDGLLKENQQLKRRCDVSESVIATLKAQAGSKSGLIAASHGPSLVPADYTSSNRQPSEEVSFSQTVQPKVVYKATMRFCFCNSIHDALSACSDVCTSKTACHVLSHCGIFCAFSKSKIVTAQHMNKKGGCYISYCCPALNTMSYGVRNCLQNMQMRCLQAKGVYKCLTYSIPCLTICSLTLHSGQHPVQA